MGVGAGEGVVELACDEGSLVVEGLDAGGLGLGQARVCPAQHNNHPEADGREDDEVFQVLLHLLTHEPGDQIRADEGEQGEEELKVAASVHEVPDCEPGGHRGAGELKGQDVVRLARDDDRDGRPREAGYQQQCSRGEETQELVGV